MDKDMVNNIIFLIGSFVVAVMILGIPVLLTLSIIFRWPGAILFTCAFATLGILCCVWACIYLLHDEYF